VLAHPTIDWTSARLGRPPGVVVVLMCLGGLRRDRSGSYAVLTPDGCLYGLIDEVAHCLGQLVDGVTHGRRFHVRGGSLMDGIDPYGNPSTHRRRSIGALSGH
jgi:hypothetical protein